MTVTCKECRSDVDEEARTCPNCGYSPKSKMRKYGLAMYAGAGLAALTGVGLIVAIPLAYYAAKMRRDGEEMDVSTDLSDY